MRFLVHVNSGDGCALSWRLQEEGAEVDLFIKDTHSRPMYKNLVPKVDSLESGLDRKPDVVIFDSSGTGEIADSVRRRGFRVIGAGSLCDLLELNRTKAMWIAEKMGVLVPEYEVFKQNEVDKAMFHVEQTGDRFVLKPSGDAPLEMTYCSKGPEDMIAELEWAKKKGAIKSDFILQKFIEGKELSTEMWFSDGDPVPQLANGTIEIKKFLAGDKGPATGCESSITWGYHTDSSKAVEQTVKRLYPIFKEYAYTGPIDVNAIISNGEAYFLEFTPRFGYSAIYALCELIEGDLGGFLYGLATRRTSDLSLKEGVGMAITLSIPPYPLNPDKPHDREAIKVTQGKRIMNLPADGFWPFDVMSDGEELLSAGTSGLIGYVSAFGKTVEEADEAVYEKLDEIQVADMQFRIDGSSRAEKDIPALKADGYDCPDYCKSPPKEQPVTEEKEDSMGIGDEDDE
jgi:phosphoribosylamine---glycine ligase